MNKLPEGWTVTNEGGRYIVRRNGERLANVVSMKEAHKTIQWYLDREKGKKKS